jgi:hypothetical protein
VLPEFVVIYKKDALLPANDVVPSEDNDIVFHVPLPNDEFETALIEKVVLVIFTRFAFIKLLYCPEALLRLTPSQITHPLGSVVPVNGATLPVGGTVGIELKL